MSLDNDALFSQFRRTMDGTSPTLWAIRAGTEKDSSFKEFLEAVKKWVPSVEIKTDDALSPRIPGIRVRKNLVWHAIPEGPELAPFLEALSGGMDHPLKLAPEAASDLSSLEAPADVSVFIAPGCPFCPSTVRHLLPLAFHSDMIYLKIVDGFLFAEEAEKMEVRSVPTTVLDGVYRWTGLPPLTEIVRVITNRDPESLGPVAFENLIGEGKAGRVARMMSEKGKIFPAFLDVLCHPQWPVRLGAMVAVEHLMDEKPTLGPSLERLIWDRFESVSDPVKGDLLHVLGEIGGEETFGRLKMMNERGFSSDILEAIQEAMETIVERK